ncbi:MAG TPA: hypothetical protein VHY09_08080, partial [Candidatus Methylacidiphilales bacterium]|nr:hypothetical protein [Candidatus Methylacidiphilales bacterium]
MPKTARQGNAARQLIRMASSGATRFRIPAESNEMVQRITTLKKKTCGLSRGGGKLWISGPREIQNPELTFMSNFTWAIARCFPGRPCAVVSVGLLATAWSLACPILIA